MNVFFNGCLVLMKEESSRDYLHQDEGGVGILRLKEDDEVDKLVVAMALLLEGNTTELRFQVNWGNGYVTDCLLKDLIPLELPIAWNEWFATPNNSWLVHIENEDGHNEGIKQGEVFELVTKDRYKNGLNEVFMCAKRGKTGVGDEDDVLVKIEEEAQLLWKKIETS